MNKSSDITVLLTLLILLTILQFVRTSVYILFDHDLVDLDKKLGLDNEKLMEIIFLIFCFIRIYIISIVLFKRSFQNDLLTYGLIYLFISGLIRCVYDYLYFKDPKNKYIKTIDSYQDIDAILVFLSSLTIIRFVFFM
jgi:uncharacterized membrane protein